MKNTMSAWTPGMSFTTHLLAGVAVSLGVIAGLLVHHWAGGVVCVVGSVLGVIAIHRAYGEGSRAALPAERDEKERQS